MNAIKLFAQPVSDKHLLVPELDDAGEGVSLQTGASYESAVYVGHSHELFDVVRFDTAPIKNPYALGKPLAEVQA